MNHLGVIIQKQISKRDIVLDVGCGIMQATMDTIKTQTPNKDLKCRAVLGIDAFVPYLERIKDRPGIMVIAASVTDPDFWKQFLPNSFDVVLATDIIEHLNQNEATELIKQCERIARKCVILYTPVRFYDNSENTEGVKEYGIDSPNPLQRHKCLISEDYIKSQGYETSNILDEGILGIKRYDR